MRNFVFERIVAETAEELSLPKKLVDRAYRAYWRAVREHISTLPLKDDLSNEDFSKLQPNVNIPSIGKLYVTVDKYRWFKDRFEQLKQLRKTDDAENNKD